MRVPLYDPIKLLFPEMIELSDIPISQDGLSDGTVLKGKPYRQAKVDNCEVQWFILLSV